MPPTVRRIQDYSRLLRPLHWVKNGVIAIPLFFTPESVSSHTVSSVLIAIVAFCLVASAIYIINDWVDRFTDVIHPIKRLRPLASGAVRPSVAWILVSLLMLGGFSVGATLGASLLPYLASYAAINIAYSLYLKHYAIIDVCIISLGFIIRVQAGVAVIDAVASPWILILTGLLAMFLALAKRRDDFVLHVDREHRRSLGGYNAAFLDLSVAIMLGALLVAYLIYTTDAAVIAHYGSRRLHYTAIFVAAGILRYLQITIVEQRSGSPTEVIMSDRFLLSTFFAWLISFGILIYGRDLG